VAAWSVHDVWRGWCRGLQECGIKVMPFSMSDRFIYYEGAVVTDDDGNVVKQMDRLEAMEAASRHILAAAYEFQPDVVFVVHGANVDPAALRHLRCPLVLVLTESPYEDQMQSAFANASHPDLILLNDPTHQGTFNDIAPTFYAPHAYDPKVHYPGCDSRSNRVPFIATLFPNRVEWLEQVDWTDIDLALAGECTLVAESVLRRYVMHQDDLQECLSNDETADLYRSSAAGFNVYRYEQQGEHSKADGWAIGPREVEMPMCGLWMARQPRPEGDELFPMLPTFTEPGELGDLLRWAIAHPEERQAAADLAAQAVADRTFANNAKRALARLDI
jgi:hypothetical protein